MVLLGITFMECRSPLLVYPFIFYQSTICFEMRGTCNGKFNASNLHIFSGTKKKQQQKTKQKQTNKKISAQLCSASIKLTNYTAFSY
jgi:hypothetical protein